MRSTRNAGHVRVAVVPDHVPVPEAQHHTVGIEAPLGTPVGEGHRGVAAHRVEQHREAGAHVELGERGVGACAGQPAQLGQTLVPASPSRRTTVTATCSAASSASVSASSGR